MVCRARFRARSPPRLRRCRMVRPLLASSGRAPARVANAASLRHRPGWEKLTIACAALTGPMPCRSVSPGARSSTISWSWRRLSLSCLREAWRARARRRISPWRIACSRLACVGLRLRASVVKVVSVSEPRAACRSRSWPVSSSARSRLVCAVCVVVRSCRAPSRIRSASRSPSVRGVGSRSASSASAVRTARCASIGSDLPLPRRCLRCGCSHSITHSPAVVTARASPMP